MCASQPVIYPNFIHFFFFNIAITHRNEHFKISCDFARASFNSSGLKIACGSADGAIYIWNVNGFLEATLKGHRWVVKV